MEVFIYLASFFLHCTIVPPPSKATSLEEEKERQSSSDEDQQDEPQQQRHETIGASLEEEQPEQPQQSSPDALEQEPVQQETITSTMDQEECIASIDQKSTSTPVQQQSIPEPVEGSPEYVTMKEMLADLIHLLTGNAPVILQLNNRFYSHSVIPYDVYNAVAHLHHTPNERATRLINSLLTIIQTHSNPNSVFYSLIVSLQKVGFKNMASKLMEKLSKIKVHNYLYLIFNL